MYLYLGQSEMVPEEAIIGLFDLDNTTWSFRTRCFLKYAEKEGRVITIGEDLPRSFILSQEGDGPSVIFISQFTTATLVRRAEENSYE